MKAGKGSGIGAYSTTLHLPRFEVSKLHLNVTDPDWVHVNIYFNEMAKVSVLASLILVKFELVIIISTHADLIIKRGPEIELENTYK